MNTFTVPGTLTLADVTRRPRGETWAEAMHRLAAKGLIQGCQTLDWSADQARCRVMSSSVAGRAYRVWLDHARHTGICSCTGYEVNGICQHIALALAECGALPALDTEPLAAVYPGRCAMTGRVIRVGDLITKSATGGWVLLVDADAIAA
jgi:hypothetical protein